MGLKCDGTEEGLEQLKGRWVSFRIRDVYLPSPQELLTALYGAYVLQGKVTGLSTGSGQEGGFLVLEQVEGYAGKVIIPAKCHRGVV